MKLVNSGPRLLLGPLFTLVDDVSQNRVKIP